MGGFKNYIEKKLMKEDTDTKHYASLYKFVEETDPEELEELRKDIKNIVDNDTNVDLKFQLDNYKKASDAMGDILSLWANRLEHKDDEHIQEFKKYIK
jgi:chorismate synthase